MGSNFEIRGAQDLARLSKKLKDAGRNDLRKELLKGVRESGASAVLAIRDSALENLPRRGGLAAKVAAEKASVRATYGAKGAHVQLRRKRGRGLNQGRLRHPVYGNRDVWVQQPVNQNWFDDPIRDAAPEIRRKIEAVVKRVNYKLTKGL